jgi:hypothetical protein
MPKRRRNLDEQSVMQAAAEAAVPVPSEGGPSRPITSAAVFVRPGPAPTAPATDGHKSLSVKLNAADYTALLDFCTRQERETGKHVTHQEAMVMALRRLVQEEEQHISEGDRHSTIVG